MSETLSLKSNIDLMWLSRMPEVFTTGTKETDDDIILEGILAALDEALEGLNTMRMREGENLKTTYLNMRRQLKEMPVRLRKSQQMPRVQRETACENAGGSGEAG